MAAQLERQKKLKEIVAKKESEIEKLRSGISGVAKEIEESEKKKRSIKKRDSEKVHLKEILSKSEQKKVDIYTKQLFS